MDRSVKKLLAVLRFSIGIAEEQPFDLKVELVHKPSGRKIPVEFLILDSKKFGLDDAMLLEIKLPAVEPDVYTLNMTLSDPQSGLKALTSRTFRIR